MIRNVLSREKFTFRFKNRFLLSCMLFIFLGYFSKLYIFLEAVLKIFVKNCGLKQLSFRPQPFRVRVRTIASGIFTYFTMLVFFK